MDGRNATRSAGAIVIDPWRNNRPNDPSSYGILLMKQRAGQIWGLPKGHINADETLMEGAERELREETGLVLSRLQNGVDYAPFHLQDRNLSKHPHQITIKRIHFFVYVLLRRSQSLRLQPQDTKEVARVSWFSIHQLKTIPSDDPTFKRNRTLAEPSVQSLERVCFRLHSSEQFCEHIRNRAFVAVHHHHRY